MNHSSDKMECEMLTSEDHFLLQPEGDFTHCADKREVETCDIHIYKFLCSSSEHLNTLVKV